MNCIKKIISIMLKPVLIVLDNVQFRWTPMFLNFGPTSYKLRAASKRKIINCILPGDVILTRHDHYITSKMVPGYYSHIGIFVGDNSVISAMKQGVIKEDILDFLRVDEAVVLRITSITNSERKDACKEAYKQLGKCYDYKFDFENSDKFSCIELIQKCFSNIKGNGIKQRKHGFFKGKIFPDDIFNSSFVPIFRSR